MKLFSAIAAAAVIGGSCISSLPVKATIWADLNNKTVLGKNDNITDVYITFNGKTQRVKHVDAALPVDNSTTAGKTQTASMTEPGFEYYMTIFKRDLDREKAFKLGDQNQWQGRNSNSSPKHRANRRPISIYNAGPGMQQQNMQHQINMLQMKQRHIQMYGY